MKETALDGLQTCSKQGDASLSMDPPPNISALLHQIMLPCYSMHISRFGILKVRLNGFSMLK